MNLNSLYKEGKESLNYTYIKEVFIASGRISPLLSS